MDPHTPHANVWDTGCWSKVQAATFDFMTRHIMARMAAGFSFEGKTVLELGCGTGRLGYLALQRGARRVTLVDSSQKAVELARALFSGVPAAAYEIRAADILAAADIPPHDMVFSSGVIEHFRADERRAVIEKHLALAGQDCLIVHPTDTLYNRLFSVFPPAVKRYGFQLPFSDEEMDRYLRQAAGGCTWRHERFYFFYTVPGLHNCRINQWLDRTALGTRWGKLTLTHVKRGAPAGPAAA